MYSTQAISFCQKSITSSRLNKIHFNYIRKTCLKDLLDKCVRINSKVDNTTALNCFAKEVERMHLVMEYVRILCTISPIRFLNLVANKLPNEFIESDCEIIV